MRATVRWAERLICAAFLALIAIALASHVRLEPVLTGSMAPGLPVGTLVAVTPVTPADLHVGQVIMFHPPRPYAGTDPRPYLHRIVSISRTPEGRRELRTKGDANATEDPWTLEADRGGLGLLQGSSVAAGDLVRFLRNPTSPVALLTWTALGLAWLLTRLRSQRRQPPHPRRRGQRPKHAHASPLPGLDNLSLPGWPPLVSAGAPFRS
jgi:signal peptidase I